MDLVRAFSAMQSASLAAQVQVAVARKMLDAQQMQGAAALQLLESAAQAGTQAGDALVVAATGLGGQIDTYA